MTTTNRADESLGGDETRKTIDFAMGADLRSKPEQLKLFNKLVKFLLREKKKPTGLWRVKVSLEKLVGYAPKTKP
jgi:hypothetical protein